jgi:hypothetical protein
MGRTVQSVEKVFKFLLTTMVASLAPAHCMIIVRSIALSGFAPYYIFKHTNTIFKLDENPARHTTPAGKGRDSNKIDQLVPPGTISCWLKHKRSRNARDPVIHPLYSDMFSCNRISIGLD